MARYRAQAALYMGRGVTIKPGETFTSDATPGRNWQPLDDVAKAAVDAAFPNGKPLVKELGVLVPIPDNWAAMHWTQRASIAKQIAGELKVPDGKTEAQAADDIIKAELARRATAPQT
jgi:hypothetical protein